MAEMKVSEMIEAEQVNDEDLIMIVQNGVNKKVPASKVGTGQAGGEVLPVGSEIEFDGDSEEIPVGWEEVDDPYTYSTEEKVVGTWIDGKPLYEITLTGTKNAGADLIIDVSNLNIENFFFAGGGLKSNAGIGYELSRYEPNGVWTRPQINDLGEFHFTTVEGLGEDYVSGLVIAILRYTKTTD